MSRKQKLISLALLLGFAAPATCQIITSSIVGQISDATGSAVPDAEVTATNTGTGIAVKTRTDSSGTYSLNNLQFGTYDVTAAKTGFETFRITGVQLLASQAVRVDVKLQVGQVQQTVDVTGAAPLVQTESPTIGGTIGRTQIAELPLAQQSIDQLIALTPGAQVAGSNPQTGGATHWGAVNFTINGVQANDFGNGAGAYSFGLGLVSLPGIQSMEEFKVEAYNTNAEYRNLGTITMVTRAGTNQYHGELYEYNQNKSLEANTFLNNALDRARNPFIRNQFGVNFGGPIKKNKAFFFADYTGMRNRLYNTTSLTIPSMAMRQGDFSALCGVYDANGVCADPKGTQLYNPFTGNPFPNNKLPSSMITSQAQTLLKYLPAPTNLASSAAPNSTPNYFGLVSTAQDVNAADLRIDYQISSTDQLYGVYSRNVGDPWQWYLGTPSTYGNGSNYGYKTFGYSLVETHTFSPHLLNDFRFAWFDHPGIRSGQNLDFDPTTLFPQLTKSPNRGLPTMTMAGYTGMFTDIGKGYYGHGYSTEFTDNLTYVHGRHTFKFGGETTVYKTYGPNPNAPLGTFTFNGQWTGNKGWPGQPQSQGNSFADFLIGTANSSTAGLAGVFEGVYSAWDSEAYFQDTWQATPKLTVYYGVRYMYETPWKWQDGYSTYWDPKTNKLALPENSATPTLPAVGASAALFAAYPFTTTQALGISKNYMIGDKNNWGPRVGFAWRPFSDNRTVFRAGYGVFYNFNPAFAGSRDDILNPPWVGGLGGFSTGTFNTRLPGNPTAPYLPDITFANPFPASLQTASGAPPNPNLYSMQRNFVNAAIQQWNGTLEHQFTDNWAARITYAGSQSHHLQWFFGDLNVPETQTPNVPIQQQRPYQPWNTIYSTRSGASQNFDQLQLEATKRMSYGFNLQVEYAWTRSLDNVDYSGGPQNPNFPGLDYGNSAGIRRHSLVFDYLWELPFGRGKQFLSGLNRGANLLLGGWQISGISSYMTGAPFSVSFSVPTNDVGWWGGRADQVGSNVYSGQQSGHDIVDGVKWFNVGAFAPPKPWTWGNSSRDMLFGPGSWNWDMSLAKHFKVTERYQLELRGDFLDAFNHFNLSGPSSTIADTRDGGLPNANSGLIFSGTGNRVVQVGAKFLF